MLSRWHALRPCGKAEPMCLWQLQPQAMQPWLPLPGRGIAHRVTERNRPLQASGTKDSNRFVCEPPRKPLKLKVGRSSRGASLSKPTNVKPMVDVMVESYSGLAKDALEELCEQVQIDAGDIMQRALIDRAGQEPRYKLPHAACLTVVLCGDRHIRALNFQHRNRDEATDVLSFDMADEIDYQVHLPMKLLGDVVISLDTAARQAEERKHSLEDEVRVLLVHGILHLCGHDHERGPQEHAAMAEQEQRLMAAMGWSGVGLITAQEQAQESDAAVAASAPAELSSKQDEDRSLVAAAYAATKGAPLSSKQGEGRSPQSGGVAAADSAPGLGVIWQASGGAGRSNIIRRAAVAAQGKCQQEGAAAASGAGSVGSIGADRTRSSPTRPGRPESSSETLGQVSDASTTRLSKEPAQEAPVGGTSRAAVAARPARSSEVKLVALDMDGTLLDSNSKILPSSVQAIKAACKLGVRVILATGKARPAAIAACERFGLQGDRLLVSPRTPGLFLQGLAVHGAGGVQLSDAQLPRSVVKAAFRFVEAHPQLGVTACAFLGDECATLSMTDDIHVLHDTYYEPLAKVFPSLKALLDGPPVKKILFMAQPSVIDREVRPHWETASKAAGSRASVLQAVPNMLELVPEGVNKWVGAQVLLKSLGIPHEGFMAVGDGGNDYEMVANAGIGVAMGNAVSRVKEASDYVVAGHDDGGIAEAFERFVL